MVIRAAVRTAFRRLDVAALDGACVAAVLTVALSGGIAAQNSTSSGTAAISGAITEAGTGIPLSGVTVELIQRGVTQAMLTDDKADNF